MSKLGQFGHTFRRGMKEYVQTVEERMHKNPEAGMRLWKNITLFVGMPLIGLAMFNSYLNMEHETERPPIVHYPYLKIMNKPFPWGDGKHSFFHNPKTNWIPGIGYEE